MAKDANGIDPHDSLPANAVHRIEARLEAMLAYEHCLAQPEKVYELHQMRIAAKRLRYTMEVFQDVYKTQKEVAAVYKNALEEVRGLQDHLGELHDADVLVPQLTEHLARLLSDGFGTGKKGVPVVGVHRVDLNACQGLLSLCKETRAARDIRYGRLLEDWQRIRAAHVFEHLIGLLHEALSGEALAHTDSETDAVSPPRARPTRKARPAPPASKDETDHGKDLAAESAGSETPHQARGRANTRRGTTRRTAAANSRRHPRPGSDPSPGAPESGV